MIAPLWKLDWRLGFLLAAGFFAAGAFVVRNWLRRENLNGEWTALYFFLFGALYYTQSLVAAVPAAVTGLFGVSLLLRERPRPMLAGLTLGASVLLHPWMGPFAIVSAAVWLLENRRFDLVERAGQLIAGALAPIAMLAVYNFATTGSPFRNDYTLLRHQNFFVGEHFVSYVTFYAASLAIFPLAGWVVFSPKWARLDDSGESAAMFTLASLYYYRDGFNLPRPRCRARRRFWPAQFPANDFLFRYRCSHAFRLRVSSTRNRREYRNGFAIGQSLWRWLDSFAASR